MANDEPLPLPANLTLEGLRTIDASLLALGWQATRTYDEFRFFALGDLRTRLEGPAGHVQSAQIALWSAEEPELDEARRIALGRAAYLPIRAKLFAALAGAPSGDWAGPAGERRDDTCEFVVESDVWKKDGLQIASFLEHVDDANPVTILVELYPLQG